MSKQISIILDTSVFHNIDYSSGVLYKLKQIGKIRVIISPMLIEEISKLMLFKDRIEDAKKRIGFILDISSERWLEDNFNIFKFELGLLPRRKDYQYLQTKCEEILKDNYNKFLAGGRFSDETYNKIIAEEKEKNSKTRKLRKVGCDMRETVNQVIKNYRKKHKDINVTWQDYKSKNLDRFGIGLIRRKGCYSNIFQSIALFRWLISKNKCPYFNDWTQGLLYWSFYCMKYPDAEIDINAQADIQHLIYLREVDAIVSDEKKFMRKVWEDLYKPLGKEYYSISEIEKLL